jgi:hypothetical protein
MLSKPGGYHDHDPDSPAGRHGCRAAAAIPSHAGTGPLSQAFSLRFGGSESFFISARPAALRVPASAAAVQVGPGLPQAPGPASRHRHGVPSAPSPRLSSPHRASDRDFQGYSVSESPTRQWPRVSDRRRGTDLNSEIRVPIKSQLVPTASYGPGRGCRGIHLKARGWGGESSLPVTNHKGQAQ